MLCFGLLLRLLQLLADGGLFLFLQVLCGELPECRRDNVGIPAESLVASTQRATVRWVTSSCMSDYLLSPLPYRSWFTMDA